MKKNSAFTLRSGNKPSFAKLSGVQKSPMRKNGEEKTAETMRDDAQYDSNKKIADARSKGDEETVRYEILIQSALTGRRLTKEENQFLLDYQAKKKAAKKAKAEAGTKNVAKMKKSPAKKNGGNKKSHSDPDKRTVYFSDDKHGLRKPGSTVETKKDMILSSKQKNKKYSVNKRGDVVVHTEIVDKRGNVVRTKTKTYKQGTPGYRRMFKKADKISKKSRE
jgi:hypothetical protein